MGEIILFVLDLSGELDTNLLLKSLYMSNVHVQSEVDQPNRNSIFIAHCCDCTDSQLM